MHAWAMAWLDVGIGSAATALLGRQSARRRLLLTAAGSAGSGTTRWLLHPTGDGAPGLSGGLMLLLAGALLCASVTGLLVLWLHERAAAAPAAPPQALPGRRR